MNLITQPRTRSAQGSYPLRLVRLGTVGTDQPPDWPWLELGLAAGE